MKYQAVIFDLFGTLIPNFSEREYHEVVRQMASILDAPEETFWQLWKNTFNERALGILPDLESQITQVCRNLSLQIGQDKVREAVRLRFNYEKAAIIPRPDAIQTLAALTFDGIKTGLISDCSSEVPAIWNDTALAPFFDVTLFSCSAGVRKPDPRIYHLAMEQLCVEPADCLYVGDGSSRELSGASQAGMTAVQLRVPGEDNPDVYKIDKEDWQGRIVASLGDVLTLVNIH
jgi:putative hydrolase of the HAD superfamily